MGEKAQQRSKKNTGKSITQRSIAQKLRLTTKLGTKRTGMIPRKKLIMRRRERITKRTPLATNPAKNSTAKSVTNSATTSATNHYFPILLLSIFVLFCLFLLYSSAQQNATGRAATFTDSLSTPPSIFPPSPPLPSPFSPSSSSPIPKRYFDSSSLTALTIEAANDVEVGDTFTVEVRLSNAVHLQQYSFTFYYNPSKLKYERSFLGGLLSQGSPTTVSFEAPKMITEGQLRDIRAWRNDRTGVSGNGELLTLMFTALAEGQADLFADNVILLDDASQEMPLMAQGMQLSLQPKIVCIDYDLDGYGQHCSFGADCNDADASIYPDAVDICGNTIDDDCDGRDLPCPISMPSSAQSSNQLPSASQTASQSQTTSQSQTASQENSDSTRMLQSIPGSSADSSSSSGSAGSGSSSSSSSSSGSSSGSAANAASGSSLLQNSPNGLSSPTAPDQKTNPEVIIPSTPIVTTAKQVTLPYQVSNSKDISSCTLVFNGQIAQKDSSLTTAFIVTLIEPGAYHWKVFCTTAQGQNIQSQTAALYYFAISEFGEGTTAIGQLKNMQDVLNFRLVSSKGSIQFTQSVDLTAATNLDSAIEFLDKGISMNPTAAQGINRPAKIELPNIPYRDPYILRNQYACNPPLCTITDYSNGILAFTVPGMNEYTVKEGYVEDASRKSTPASTDRETPQRADHQLNPCTFSFAVGRNEVQLQLNSLLCVTGDMPIIQYKITEISNTQLGLMQLAPEEKIVTLALQEDYQYDFDDDEKDDAVLTFLSKENDRANIRFLFLDTQPPRPVIAPVRTPAVALEPQSKLAVEELPMQSTQPIIMAKRPSGNVQIQQTQPEAQQQIQSPQRFHLPLYWIGALLMLTISGIVIGQSYFTHSIANSPSPQKNIPAPAFDAHLKQELSGLGISAERAAETVKQKEARRKGVL